MLVATLMLVFALQLEFWLVWVQFQPLTDNPLLYVSRTPVDPGRKVCSVWFERQLELGVICIAMVAKDMALDNLATWDHAYCK